MILYGNYANNQYEIVKYFSYLEKTLNETRVLHSSSPGRDIFVSLNYVYLQI